MAEHDHEATPAEQAEAVGSGDGPGLGSDDLAEPTDSLVGQALDVLAQAVTQLIHENSEPPTASEVHLRMRTITYGGFKTSSLGFKRFRDFLSLGEERGVVEIDHTRPGDVSVTLPGEAGEVSFYDRRVIRKDLWRAVVDWSPGLLRLYSRNDDKAYLIPKNAAPLEPERIAVIRNRYAVSPEEFVEIPPADIGAQIAWMHDFALTVADHEVRTVLLSSLDSEKPAKTFASVLRQSPSLQRKWYTALTDRVTSHLQNWMGATGLADALEIHRLNGGKPPTMNTKPMVSRPSRESTSETWPVLVRQLLSIIQDANYRTVAHPERKDQEVARWSEGDLRARIHRAVDKMSVDELKKLPIPVGYLIED